MRLLLFVAFLFSSLTGFTAPSGYSFYKKLSVQESQITVNNNSLSGFPVLVRITDADLKSVANGGRVQSNNGYDIVYTASDMNTLIPFQMESYDAVTGTLVAWVKVPIISATVNTDFYLFFGNASNTINLGSKSTWDVNYKGVYHLHADVTDGTINASNLTNTGTTNFFPGLAADGQRIGSGNYLSRAATAGLQITGDFTLEAWMLPNSLISGSNENIVLSSSSNNNGAAATNINYCLSISGSGGSAGTLIFKWQYGNNSDEQVSSTAPITNTTVGWHNISVVRDVTAKQVRFYFDGVQLGAAVSFSNLPSGGSSNSFLIGKNLQDPGRTIDAAFDEVRISNSIRTPEWIQAEYNNYKPASTFITYSPTSSVSPSSFCFCSIDMSDFTSLGTFNSHTYYVSTQKANWQNADSIARSRGGHLVSITSFGENTFLTLASLLSNVWTGLNDSITEGTFVWSSGEPFSYSNWALLQPDNSGNSDYALFGLLGSWDDQKNNPQLFVIEFDCTAPTPVTVNAGPDQTVCGNAANLSATPIPVSAFGSWSLLSGAGSIANPSVASTTVSGLDKGPNSFIWKVGNGSCNTSTDTVVIFTDTIKPTIICPANSVVNNSLGLCSGIATWTVPTFTDNCPGASIVQTAGLPSGSAFPLGNSTIKYIATDGNGNFESCGFDVIVIDNELPKINCSGNLSFPSDPGLCGTIVTGITPLNFSDNCGGFNITHLITGSTSVSGINDASGTFFNVGTSQVRYTITDAAGGSAACNFNVTITDNASPTFTFCPADMTVNAIPGLCSTIVTWPNPVAVDNCPGVVVTQASGLPSGTSFPVGIYSIKYVATDASGNSTNCIFTITVLDIESPVISNCPNNITIPSDPGFCTAVATWTSPNASDNCSGVTISQVGGLASGSAFTVGTTSITYKAIDAAGLSTLCTFTVTVLDNTNPVIANCPGNITVNNNIGQCNAVVTWVLPSVTDNCGSATISQVTGPPSGSLFPLGVTPISYFAIDAAGNSATCSFNVTVIDAEQPQITCPGNVNVANDAGVCTATVFGIAPQSASDNCPGSTLSYTISGATTSTGVNDASGTIFNQGTSLVTYSIKDAVGNIRTCNFNVTVTPAVPSVSDAGPNQSICSTVTNMAANNPTSGNGLWSLVSGNGTIVSPSSPTSQISGLSIGTTVFRWTISTSPCTFSSSDVSITAINTPSISFAGADQTTLCGVTSTILSANSPFVGTGTWTIVSGAGGSFSLNTNPAATFTGTLGTTYVLRWTIANAPCTSSTDDVTITFNNNPTTANAGADQTNLCGVTSTTLAANTPTTGTGTWSIVSGAGGSFSLNTNPVATFTGTLGTTYVLRWTIANSPCSSSTDDVTITFNNNPTTANAGADQTNLCGVTSTTLAANIPTVGTGAWSIVSGAGGSFSLNTNPATTFTGTLGTTYVLRWTIANAPCTSSTDDVTITFNNNPTSANAGANQTNLCGVTSTILAANTPTNGTGTWSIVSGAGGSFSLNTNPVATFTGTLGTTYVLRWTIANSPCSSSTDDVTITFNNNPTTANAGADQTNLCGVTSTTLAANIPTVGTGAWSIVSGTGGSFSLNTNPSATFTGTIGTTYVLRWTIANAPCTSSTDDVTITFNNNTTTANAGTDQTNLCGVTSTTLAANTPAVGTGIWSIISGAGGLFSLNTNPVATFTGTLGTTYVLRWTIENSPCSSSSDDVNITFNNNPTTANAGADQTNLCGVISTTLAANTPTVGTGTWSIVSGAGGSFNLNTNPVATFTGTLGTTYVLRWTIANAPCTSSTDDVTITFNNNPTTANAGADQTNLCGVTSTALAANTPTVGTGTWSIISGAGGSFSLNTNPAATFTGTLGTSYVLRWTIANAPCTSSTDDVTITFINNPTTASAGTDQTSLCGVTSTTLAANTPTVGTGTWSIVSGAGGSFNLNTNPVATFTGTLGTTYVLRWTIANAPCTSSTDDVTITFNNNPTTANAGADQTNLCGVTSTALAANTPTVGTGTWSIISGAGGSFSLNTNPAATFTGTLGTSYVLRWTIANAPCTSSTDDVTITFINNPTTASAGTDQISLCGVTSTTLAANTPTVGTGTWSIISGAGGSFSLNTNPAATFTGTLGTTYVLRWTIANAPCSSSTDDVTITFNNNPTTANAGADQTSLCGVTSTTLAANAPTAGTGIWSIVSGAGGSFSLNTNPAATFTGTLGITYVLRWTIASAPCANSTDNVTITFNNNPTTANAGADQTSLCGITSTTLAANTPTNGTGTWTIVSGAGGGFSLNTNPAATFTGTLGTTYVLRWTIANAPCTSSTDDVTITFNNNPTTANAGADQTNLCGVTSTTLAANTPTVGTGTWSIISGAGGSFSLNTNPAATFTGVLGTTYVLRWTIANAPCTNSIDDVTITFNNNPTTANAGADQTNLCGVTSATLAANTPIVGTGTWSIISGAGGSFSLNTNPAATFTGTLGTSYVLRWTIANAPCTSGTDDVTITFNNNPTTANAGGDQTNLCGVTSITLAANTPTVGIGTWSIVSGAGGSFSLNTNPAATFTGTLGTTYVLRWTIANAPCTSSTDDVTITFNNNPTTANAGADQTNLCGVTSTTLAANTPTVGTGTWSIVSGAGGSFSLNTNPAATFTGTLGTTYVLRWTIANAPCANSIDEVNITFNNNPTTANAGSDQTGISTCGLTGVTLAGNIPTSGTGSWSIVSGGLGSFTNVNQNNSFFSGSPGVTYVLRWTISTACGASTDDVSIKVNLNPTTAFAGNDATLSCNEISTTLSANNPISGIGTWSILAGAGGSFSSITDPSAVFTGTPTNTAAVTYTLQWTISNAPCNSNNDQVEITFPRLAATANAGLDQTTSCSSSSTALNAILPANHSGVWTIVSGSGGSFSNATSPSATFSGVSGNSYQLRWTLTRTANGCTSSDDVTITFPPGTSIADAGPDQNSVSTCNLTSTTLSASIPTIGTGSWSIVSGLGGSFSDPQNPSTTFNGTIGTSYTLRWTITNPPCIPSTDDVNIVFNNDPTAANAGSDQVSLCGVSSIALAANSPVNGLGTWSILSGSGGSFSAINDPNAIFNGVLGNAYQLRWTISNSPCIDSFDDVSITFNENPSVSNAGINQTICGTSTQLAANIPSSGSGNWSVISGSANVTNTSDPTSSVNGLVIGATVLRWTISTAICGSSFSDVSIQAVSNPTIANAGPNQILCNVTSTTLAANSPTVGAGIWTISSGVGGSFSDATDPSATFSGNAGETYQLVWTISNAPCLDSFDETQISFNTNPTLANAGIDQTICSPTATLAANVPLSGQGSWTLITGAAQITNSLSPTTTVSGLAIGLNVFRWTISTANCSFSNDDISIVVTENPSGAIAGSNQTICAGVTNLNADIPNVGSGVWSKVSGSGTLVSPLSANSLVTGLTAGSSVFQWTVSNGVCPPSFSTVTILVSEDPSNSSAGIDQTICGNSTTLAANAPSVGIGNWSVISGSGSFANPTNENTLVSGLSIGQNVFRWTISNPPCADKTDDVTITVSTIPAIADAGPNQLNLCGTTTTNLDAIPAAVGTDGLWTIVSGLGGTVQTPSSHNSTFTGLPDSSYVLRWTISSVGCSDSFDEVTIQFKSLPVPADAGLDQTICENASGITLNANQPINGTGLWSLLTGSGSFSNSSSFNSPISGFSTGSNSYLWTISNACGFSSDTVVLIVDANPSTANAGLDQALCESANFLNLSANIPATGIGQWSLISGSATIAASSQANTLVTGLGLGQNVFEWSISNSVCQNSVDTVIISIDMLPTLALAGKDSTICSDVFQLSGNSPIIGAGSWITLSGGATIANSLSPTTSVSGLTIGINSFVWSINNGTCAVSSDTINITVTDLPTVAVAGPNQLICANTTQLAANAPLVGTGIWTLVSGNGIIANPSSEISQVNGLSVGTSVFRWTISNGNCAASNADVSITVTPATSLANAGSDSTICGNSIQLNAAAINNGIGTWSLVSGSGTILNVQSESTLVTGLGLGVNAFEWRIQNPPCADSFDTVYITVTTIPVTANAGTDQLNLCGTTSTILEADTINQSLGSWSIVSGNGGSFTDVFSPVSGFSGMIDSTYELRWTITALGCAGSADDVLIRFNSAPTIANAGADLNDASTCGIISLNLNANAPGSGTGAWTIVSGSGGSLASNSPTATFSGISGNTYTLEWSISSVCGISRDSVSITFNQLANLANAGANQQICESTINVQLAANSAVNGVGNWSVISGSGNFSNNSAENAILTGLSLGLNTYAWTISSVSCGTSIDTLNVLVDALPSAAFAGTDQQICESTAIVNLTANTPASGLGYWKSLNSAVLINDTLAASTSASSLLIGSNLFVWTVSNGVCPSTLDTTSVLVSPFPTASNAGADQALCENVPSINLAANSPVSGTGNWSVNSGTAIFFNASSENTSVGGLSPGLNQLVWTITNGSCPATSDTINVVVHNIPDAANAGTDQQVCESSGTVSLLANTPLIGIGNWKLLSGTGTIADTTSNSTSLNGFNAGVDILIWTITNGTCFTKDTLLVTVDAAPTTANAGIDKSICTPFTRLKADTALIGVGAWTLAAGATGNIVHPNSDTTAVLAMSIGVNSFIWTVANGVCPNSVDTVNITVNPSATIADAGPDQFVCISTDSVNLAANIALNGTGSWRLVSGSGTISDTTNAGTSVKSLSAGINLFAWVIKNGICTSSDIVKITVDELPTQASAGINQNICESTAQVNLSANAPTIGVGLWSGPGTFSNSSSESSSVSGLSIGNNSFIWTISNGACAASSDTIEIVVDALPSLANAGSDQSFCTSNLSAVNLNAGTPLIGSGAWSTTSSAIVDIITASNSSVSNLSTGLSAFVWTVSNGICPSSSDTAKIQVDQLPTQALAGSDQNSCDTFYVLNANSALIGLGQWSKLSGSGMIANPNAPVSNASGLSTGANTFVWTITNGVCIASADSVTINVSAPPSASNAGINQQICISNPSANLSANIPVNGSGLWSLASGTGVIISSGQPNTLVNNLSSGINSFIWTISNGLCGDTKDTVEIQVDELPDLAVTGVDQTFCETATGISISANTPTIGTGQWLVAQGNGSVLNPNTPVSTVTFSLGTNAYVWKISNGACLAAQDTCLVLIDSLSPLAFAGNDQTLCESNSISLNANAVAFGAGSWSSPTPGVGIANPSQPNSNATSLTLGQNSFIWTTTNGVCPAITDTVIISIDRAPSVANAGPDLSFCDTATQIRLHGNTIQIGSATWLPILGGGTILQPNDSNSLVSGLVAGLSSFEWVVTNGVCAASRDTVIVVLNESPSNSSAGSNQNICENTATITLNANNPIIGTGVWSLLNGTGSISDTNSTSPLVSGLSVGSSVFKWTIKNGLCSSTSTVVIQVDELPSQANAGEDKNIPGPTTILDATSPSIGIGVWSVLQGTASISDLNAPNSAVSNLSPGASVLQWTVTNGACPASTDEVTITYEDLQIPNAISPNNDGFNDAFVIPGLEFYSGVKFTLYNSWGNIEFESDNYQNEFKGQNKSGQALLDDTYYYILQITSDIEYKGYLIIKK